MWIEEQILQDGTATYRYCERYVDPNTGKRRKISVTLPTCSRPAIKHATAMLAAKIKARTLASPLNKPRVSMKSTGLPLLRSPPAATSTV